MNELEEIHSILHKLDKEDFEKVRFYINKITLKAIEFEKSKVKENELLHSVSVSDIPTFDYFATQDDNGFKAYDTKGFDRDLDEWSFKQGFEYGCRCVYRFLKNSR